MTHSILYYLAQIGLSLLGSICYILYVFKKGGDKYENSKKDFDDKKFAKKNKWDFPFYIAAGLGILTIKSILRFYIGIEEISDYGLSYLGGLFGWLIVEKILERIGNKN